MKNLDNFIVKFSKDITKLRLFEKNVTVTDEHTALFDKLLNQLIRRKKYALDQDCWEELYKRSLYFYKYTDNIQGIPSVFVTKHNDIVPWYCKMQVHKVPYTLWHSDCHLDTNPIKGNRHLPRLYEEYLDGRESALEEIGSIVWDIGAANSGIIYTTGPRDYIWGMPEWLPDKNVGIDYYLHGRKDKTMVSKDELAKDASCDVEYRSSGSVPDKVNRYIKIQTGKLTQKGYENLYNAIKANGEKYILDIDLDYIVCNGKTLDRKEYIKEPYDLQSHKRTKKLVINQDVPRDNNYMSIELAKYSHALNTEMKEVNYRINKLLKLIKSLYKRGVSPSHISICDSTNIKFEECRTCNSISNGYVPSHLALYVHTRVVAGLYKIFG
jgi:hypothetical protein